MQAVKEYIFSLMIISVSCGAVSMLAPDRTQLNNYIKFLISLVITVIILSPLGSLIGELPELQKGVIDIDLFSSEYEAATYTDPIIKETCELLREQIRAKLSQSLDAEPTDIEIVCKTDEVENVIIESVTVTYQKENSYLFSDTKKLLNNLFMGECEVICRYEADQ